jgi:predicted dehydrogenase
MKKVRIAICGVRQGSMGYWYARIFRRELAHLFDLAALCDVDEATLKTTGAEFDVPVLETDFARMLRDVRPEAVLIATPTQLHAQMVKEAASAGIRFIYCEKPAVSTLGEAKEMRAACAQAGAALVVGHQRRVSPTYVQLHRMIGEGAVGEVTLLRGSCGGDLFSDGTHLADSMLYLMDDQQPLWVLGQLVRGEPASPEEAARNPYAYTGVRYGRAVESGAMASLEFPGRVRCEMYLGDIQLPGAGYQDIEVLGTKGRIRLPGDADVPQFLLDTGAGYESLPVPKEAHHDYSGMVAAQELFYHTVREGAAHPMRIETAMGSLEILTGIMESARLNCRLPFPIEQMGHPLELMLQSGMMR